MPDDNYSRDLWEWFLLRASIHDGYKYEPMTMKISRHLAACGINYKESKRPGVGTVSQCRGTHAENVELVSITVGKWQCNCGDFGGPTGNTARRSVVLAIPGPYPEGRIMYEVINRIPPNTTKE